MKICIKKFGFFKGKQIYNYTLENNNGLRISVLSQGGILHEVSVPVLDGRRNLVLNYHKIDDYYTNPFYVCMLIGMTAGRLSQGQFKLGSKKYCLEPNEGSNVLHGGNSGFSNVNWSGKISENRIILSHFFKEEGGFPGNTKVTVQYILNDKNELSVLFTAKSDKNTLFNPTLHIYWNLSSKSTIKDHVLRISSLKHLQLDKNKIPTGKFLLNTGTPFDFSKPTSLGDAIDSLQGTIEKGFDDVFLIEQTKKSLIAALKVDGISVDIYSKRNGLVLFTANSFTEDMNLILGSGHPWMGVATEAQNLPDGINQEQFTNDDILLANEPKTEKITYKINF